MSTFGITVVPFLISLFLVSVLTPITVWLFKKLNWVVDPKKTPHPAHIHKEPVPKGGGLPLFVAIFGGVLLSMNLDPKMIAIILASLITVFVGLWDDIKSINPYFRIGTNFLASFIVVISGIGIAFVTNPFGGIISLPNLLADIFALLWIPTLMNAVNWSSGVDGQISGVITISALFLGILSLTYSADITQWPVSILAFSLAGSFAGFTVFHFYPQKIMPGYSATSLAGLLLGIIAILATAKVGTVILLLAVPLIDFLYVIIMRLLKGNSPVWGGRDHLHHKLMEIGWGKRRIAVFYWMVTAVLGVVALRLDAGYKIVAMIVLILLMVVFWIWRYFGHFLKH